MRKRIVNNTQMLLDIHRGTWSLDNAEAFIPLARKFLSHDVVASEYPEFSPLLADENGNEFELDAPNKNDERKVAIIPIHAMITKYWSCSSVGSVDIADSLLSAVDDDSVVGVILDIDCPGGTTNAIPPVVSAIKKIQKAGKPIIAHCDLCASAAYWIASQCDNIYMDNAMSEAGSIGVYRSLVDDRNLATGEKTISIYAVESRDKNKWYRDALDGDFKQAQEELSKVVADFHNAVKAGRPTLKTDADGVLTGALFSSEKAIENGLADGIMSLEECIENIFIRTEFL